MNSTDSTPRAVTILAVISCLIVAGIAQVGLAGPVKTTVINARLSRI